MTEKSEAEKDAILLWNVKVIHKYADLKEAIAYQDGISDFKASLKAELEKLIVEFKSDNADVDLNVMVEQFGILRIIDTCRPKD